MSSVRQPPAFPPRPNPVHGGPRGDWSDGGPLLRVLKPHPPLCGWLHGACGAREGRRGHRRLHPLRPHCLADPRAASRRCSVRIPPSPWLAAMLVSLPSGPSPSRHCPLLPPPSRRCCCGPTRGQQARTVGASCHATTTSRTSVWVRC